MSIVSITTGNATIANVSTVLAEMNIRVSENSSTVMGYQSATLLRGNYNTIIGYSSAKYSTVGNGLTIFGFGAAQNVTADDNVFIGKACGGKTLTGSNNVMIGSDVATNNETGSANVYVGNACATGMLGSANVFVGESAGSAGGATDCNVVIGVRADAAGDACVVVGHGSKSAGRQSVVVGHSVTNSGKNCAIINSTPQAVVNKRDNLIHINGRIVAQDAVVEGSPSYDMRLAVDRVFLCYDDAAETTTVLATKNALLFNTPVTTSQITLNTLHVANPVDSNVFWTMATTYGMYAHPNGHKASDLLIYSRNSNVMSITDEFAPELFNFTAKHRCKFKRGHQHGQHSSCSCDELYCDGVCCDGVPQLETPPSLGGTNKKEPTAREDVLGMIVVATGDYCNLDDAEVPTIDEAIPVVELCTSRCDPRVFGVASMFEDLQQCDNAWYRNFRLGNLKFNVTLPSTASNNDLRKKIVVNSLGEGGIWVCDENGPLRNGDFICSSSVPGHGMRQDCPQQTNYTVAKITCDCLFTSGSSRAFVGCSYRC
jgi:hypothetical protein